MNEGPNNNETQPNGIVIVSVQSAIHALDIPEAPKTASRRVRVEGVDFNTTFSPIEYVENSGNVHNERRTQHGLGGSVYISGLHTLHGRRPYGSLRFLGTFPVYTVFCTLAVISCLSSTVTCLSSKVFCQFMKAQKLL